MERKREDIVGWSSLLPVRHPRLATLTICGLVITAALASSAGLPLEAPSRSSEARVASSTTTAIGFDILGLNLSGFTIGLSFTTTLNLSGGSVVPGQSIHASAELRAPPNATLSISYRGTPVSFPVNPLGPLYDFPIPGLTYGYEGLASLGLYLNFSGTILGNTSVTGPANGTAESLSWNGSATDGFAMTVWSNATNGSVVQWWVSGVAYGLSVGIDAVGTVLGYRVSLPLVHFGSVGLFPGNPSAASATYALPSKSGASGGSGGGLVLSSTEGLIGLAALILIVVAIAAVAVRYRRRKPRGPPSRASSP